MTKPLALALFALAAFAPAAQPAASPAPEPGQTYIETDPTALFFDGVSLAVRRSALLGTRLIAGVGVYTTELPDFYIESNPDHVGDGWEVRNRGVDVFLDAHLSRPNDGLAVGSVVSVYTYALRRNGGEAAYTSLVGTVRAGYLWRPTRRFDELYVFPWIGLSSGVDVGGTRTVDGEEFELPALSVVPTVQLGVSF